MPAAIAIQEIEGKAGKCYCPLQKINITLPTPGPKQVIVKISAAALNHRDLFIRQKLYPGVTYGVPLLADGVGVVTSAGSDASAQKWLNKRVVINPGLGWISDPIAPESGSYRIVGGTTFNPAGTLAEEMLFDASEMEDAPVHLDDAEAAAVPLTGLTAWRAFFTKSGNAVAGRNILITGIGGGVALMALLFAVHEGCKVYVTSGNQEKLDKAKKLGAAGGVSYKDRDWDKQLLKMLPKDRPYIDAIIDGAGGDIVVKAHRFIKQGGVIVSYGMTTGPQIPYTMAMVLKNVELRGSTMGSRKEFADMIQFIREKKLRPVVSRVVQGLEIDVLDNLFDDMKNATQFGKLVVQINKNATSKM